MWKQVIWWIHEGNEGEVIGKYTPAYMHIFCSNVFMSRTSKLQHMILNIFNELSSCDFGLIFEETLKGSKGYSE